MDSCRSFVQIKVQPIGEGLGKSVEECRCVKNSPYKLILSKRYPQSFPLGLCIGFVSNQVLFEAKLKLEMTPS